MESGGGGIHQGDLVYWTTCLDLFLLFDWPTVSCLSSQQFENRRVFQIYCVWKILNHAEQHSRFSCIHFDLV